MTSLADARVTHTEIARQLGVSLRTVQRWTAAGTFPEHGTIVSPLGQPYARYLEQRLQQGSCNVSQLWRELRQQGYRGQLGSVRNWLRQHHRHNKQVPRTRATTPKQHTSPQHVAWLILRSRPLRRLTLLRSTVRRLKSPNSLVSGRSSSVSSAAVTWRDGTRGLKQPRIVHFVASPPACFATTMLCRLP